MTQDSLETTELTEPQEALPPEPADDYTVTDLISDLAVTVRTVSGQPRITTGETIKLVDIALQHTREMQALKLQYQTVHYPPPATYSEDALTDEQLDRLERALSGLNLDSEDDPAVDHEPTTVLN
jgi:hypothetical protein